MLQIFDMHYTFGRAQALQAINVSVREQQITNIVGSNGAGKTTIMKCISGILRPSRGRIVFRDEPIHNLPPHAIVERGVVQVPEGRKLFPSLTVRENLEMGSMHSAAKARRKESYGYVYGLFPRLLEREDQKAGTLSGGEQQMVAFGRALMGLPKLLLLDEPSWGLAPLIVKEVLAAVKKISQQGGTILLVEQNVKASLALAQWTYVIENGHIVVEGRSTDVLANEQVIATYLGMKRNVGKEVGNEQ
jgi:branched-chain amino acid transport system ATP-binding protein